MLDLTERQQQILAYIRESIETRQRPPTLREIGRAFAIRSTNGVNDHLRALERKGYLIRSASTHRGMLMSGLALADVQVGSPNERCRSDHGAMCQTRGPSPRCSTGRAA